MADVMCPLRFEDFDALMADDQLPLELSVLFEDSARTVELIGSYEMELTEAEARAPTPRATSCATWSGTFLCRRSKPANGLVVGLERP